jgi:thiamine-phosphate pyrophosphorylase
MCELIIVTNRLLCRGDFLTHVKKLARAHPTAILLREKDLSKDAYRALAGEVFDICKKHKVRMIMHTHNDIASELGCSALHVPLTQLRRLSEAEKARFPMLGTSCHSIQEAREAQTLGASYILAGHIFDTACKQGLPGRGLDFLEGVCDAVDLPVYAIGGITPERTSFVLAAGAVGVCAMSSAMECKDPAAFVSAWKKIERKSRYEI